MVVPLATGGSGTDDYRQAVVRREISPRGTDGFTLLPRETDVLERLARGYSVKEIAAQLEIGVRTVETYKSRSFEKLGLRSRTDLIRHAIQRGWLQEP
jgi:DNA-binding NarL/FixJ family response regulator